MHTINLIAMLIDGFIFSPRNNLPYRILMQYDYILLSFISAIFRYKTCINILQALISTLDMYIRTFTEKSNWLIVRGIKLWLSRNVRNWPHDWESIVSLWSIGPDSSTWITPILTAMESGTSEFQVLHHRSLLMFTYLVEKCALRKSLFLSLFFSVSLSVLRTVISNSPIQ